MKLKRLVKRLRKAEFLEDEYYDTLAVGTLYSDYGPLETPRRLPWNRTPEKPKPAFGFARALEER